jgi:hypothetical protein
MRLHFWNLSAIFSWKLAERAVALLVCGLKLWLFVAYRDLKSGFKVHLLWHWEAWPTSLGDQRRHDRPAMMWRVN